MLRKIRIAVSTIVFTLITLLFLDFTGTLHVWFGWLAKIQLVPAILAVNVVALAVLAVFSALFGRIYCSVICPLGIMQDGISNVSIRRKGKKNRFKYSKPLSWLRYGVLAVFVAGLAIGSLSIIVSLLDPAAGFGRIAAELFAPIYRLGNNVLASISERMDRYAFYSTEVWLKSWITLGVAVATLLIVSVLAWRNGRIYCNTICPVGTFLGLFSRFSVFRPTFKAENCVKCGVCEKTCKSSCVNSETMTIDYSRCVTCFNCIENCKFGAINYTVSCCKKPITTAETEDSNGMSRRSFMTIAGALVATQVLKSQQSVVDGGLAVIENKKVPHRNRPVVPPGAQSLQNMRKKCTACQLCVSACPNGVLRPSNRLETLMQPEMSFERGYCRPECVECSKVCPTGAIQRITSAQKAGISIGYAKHIEENCVIRRDRVQCTNCHRHCPTGAVMLVPSTTLEGLNVPTIYTEACIGCGACEFYCPARPFAANLVEGHSRHHLN